MKKFILTILFCLLTSVCFGAYEDFTTFTEVDEQTDIAIDTNTITVSSMRRDADSWVVKSYGAGHFDDFIHNVDIQVGTSINGKVGIWGVADSANDLTGLDVGITGIVVYVSEAGGTIAITIKDFSNDTTGEVTIAESTNYWLTITRSGTATTLQVYSDATRTIQVGTTKIVTGTYDNGFEYIYGCIGFGSGTDASELSVNILNLNINEAGITRRYYLIE